MITMQTLREWVDNGDQDGELMSDADLKHANDLLAEGRTATYVANCARSWAHQKAYEAHCESAEARRAER